MTFFVKNLFSKCKQIHIKLRICSYLLKKSLFHFCVVCISVIDINYKRLNFFQRLDDIHTPQGCLPESLSKGSFLLLFMILLSPIFTRTPSALGVFPIIPVSVVVHP